MQVIKYRLYVLASAAASDSKAFGALSDAVYRRRHADELRAARTYFAANADRAERIASLLADEQSRAAYRSLIAYRCGRERRYINPHMQKKRGAYLDRALIRAGGNEVFVDAGGFQGLTSLRFQALCKAAGQPAPQCVVFEPDPFNFSRLQKNLPKFSKPPLCFQMGLGREPGRLGFKAGALSMSKVDAAGEITVEVDTLDHVLGTRPELPPVTYIKIDTEGADLDVILGARQTIEKCRPRIAVSIYHSDAHMLEIPEAIHTILPGYKLYVRHYSCLEGETVLYCI